MALKDTLHQLQQKASQKLLHHQVNKATTNSSALVNAVYYPNWKALAQKPPSSLNLAHISHILYAFVGVKADGTVYDEYTDENADTKLDLNGALGALGDLQRVKTQNPQIKTILSLGGGSGSENFAAAASNPTSRATLANTAKQILDKYQMDGIDIDWEHPSDPGQGRDFISLLSSLRNVLPASQYLLTAALPAGEWALQNIPLGEASQLLSYLNIMTYDFAGPWTKMSGYHSQLFTPKDAYNDDCKISCDSASSYLTSKGVPANKILLGVPAYGRSFLGATKAGEPYKGGGGEEGTFEYCDLARPNAQLGMDHEVVAAYCVGGDGGFVSYDDPACVQRKAEYVKQRGLGGLFYWTGTGDTNDDQSLVATGWKALRG
ncbi:uncharacterized protein KY384_008408 [Bacidia gigantensis]|uniref:uncharacterized protein n=1 Tax=Bacidia gigantensis TaxID=2732470 RepID=UPI001D03C2F6|nr:uncharacterized protein KY384_008408 [Bacidia gigantensis]KAG8526979.1 hypothetical protein KY384_008408 [Bacidia gigantensis]